MHCHLCYVTSINTSWLCSCLILYTHIFFLFVSFMLNLTSTTLTHFVAWLPHINFYHFNMFLLFCLMLIMHWNAGSLPTWCQRCSEALPKGWGWGINTCFWCWKSFVPLSDSGYWDEYTCYSTLFVLLSGQCFHPLMTFSRCLVRGK